MKKIFIGIALMFLIVVSGIRCTAQDSSRALLRKVIKENMEAVNAIAMYPTETRKIIFESCAYPEVITKLNEMQKNSQDKFEKLISNLSKDEQENIWNLTRYDGLIADLAADHKKTQDEINNLLVNYPDEIHKTALDEGINNYDLIVQIDKMNNSFNADFEQLMNGYPPEVINYFREMIKMPEVLDILFDHMQYTVVIGDYYKKNPERVLHKTDSLNQILTQKNTQETDDWKQSLNDDPQAQQEYTQAAQDYAQDNGYQPDVYNAPLTPDVTNYYTTPYNWWFGYPSWYPYDYWTPYPYWYDWGFYYGPGGRIIIFGLPSEYFMDWYFYFPEHSYKYPKLSNHYYNYYYKHRDSMNSNTISHGVNDWRNRNKDIVTDEWDKDNVNRTQRFKEYGEMEINRKAYNTSHPRQQMERADFIKENQNKYPVIAADVSKNQLNQKDTKTKPIQENMAEPVKKPTVAIPSYYKVSGNGQNNNNVNKQQPPVNKNPQTNNNNLRPGSGNTNVQPKNTNPVKQAENFNQTRNAEQYHQNTWKQIEPQPQPVRQTQQQNNNPPAKQQENRQIEHPEKQNNPTPADNKKK